MIFKINIQNCKGNTAPHMIIYTQSKHMQNLVEELLTHGTDCTIKNDKGHTPLHNALQINNKILVELMLNKYSNFDLTVKILIAKQL